MSRVANKWAGRIYGTNTGNLYIELQQEGEKLTGIFRIMDNLYGLSIYDFTGTFKDKLELYGVPRVTNNNLTLGEVSIEAELNTEGILRGTWHSSIGTAGTFDAFPHDSSVNAQSNTKAPIMPEQVYNKNMAIGSIRLFSEDVKELISFVEKDFQNTQSIVSYTVRGSQATKYSSDFLREVETLGEIRFLKVSIQQPEAYGINRIIIVEFSETGINEVRVSGINEAWVVGAADSIVRLLKLKQSNLITNYKKYGLTLNSIIFFVMLIFIPELNILRDRAFFVFFVFLLLLGLFQIHRKFIPNTIIFLTAKKPSLLARSWPTIVSWMVVVSGSIVAGLFLYWLKKQ